MRKVLLTLLVMVFSLASCASEENSLKDRFYDLDTPYPDMRQGPNGGITDGEMTPNTMGVLAGAIRRSLIPDALTGESQYSDHELTYAPELWKAAIIWESAYKVEWRLSKGTDCAFCETFLKDFITWKHIDVIEPIARSNEISDKKFDTIHQACMYRNEPHYYITPPGVYGDEEKSPPAYGTWGFRWYKLPSGDESEVDLFIYQDPASAWMRPYTRPENVFHRRNGPIRKRDILFTEGEGLHANLFGMQTGCETRHNVLQGYDIEPFSIYAYQHLTQKEFDEQLQELAAKIKRPMKLSFSEMAVITYKGQAYFLITNLNFHSETEKNSRTLQLIAGPDTDKHPYYDGVGSGFYDALTVNTNALKASFEADIGDVSNYFAKYHN